MLKNSHIILLILFLVSSALPCWASSREIRASRGTEKIKLDGQLTEQDWQSAVPSEPIMQIEPQQFQPMTELTEIRVLFDDKNLYVGIACYDSYPELLISKQLERDKSSSGDDAIYFCLDPFNKRVNGYFFSTNPSGLKWDAQISKRMESHTGWDGVWDVKTSITDKGWFAEFAIPFSTLKVDPNNHSWGFNLYRRVSRKNESGRWNNPLGEISTSNLPYAGVITGIEPPKRSGLGVKFKPYGTFRWQKDQSSSSSNGDVGFDAEVDLDTNLKLGMSYNMDFADAEVDSRQINLSRFPTFFPEKRDFFIKDSGFYQFGGLDRGSGLSNMLLPFFSRRIGLSSTGQIVPIDYALKVNGTYKDVQIGVLNTQLSDQEGLGVKNLLVTRVSKPIFDQSSFGFLTTIGSPNKNETNYQIGPDFRFRTKEFLGNQTLEVNAFTLVNDSERSDGTELAYGASVLLPNDEYNISTKYLYLDEDYDPALGFIRQRGIEAFASSWTYNPKIESSKRIRRLSFNYYNDFIYDIDGRLDSSTHAIKPLSIDFESGDELSFSYSRDFEDIETAFNLAGQIPIAADDYYWNEYTIDAEGANNRLISPDLKFQYGEYYTGTRILKGLSFKYLPSKYVGVRFGINHNDIRIDGYEIDITNLSLRVETRFSPDLSFNHLVQYDNLSNNIGYNGRIRWEYRPGSEFFFVFNQNWQKDIDQFESELTSVILKINYLKQF